MAADVSRWCVFGNRLFYQSVVLYDVRWIVGVMVGGIVDWGEYAVLAVGCLCIDAVSASIYYGLLLSIILSRHK